MIEILDITGPCSTLSDILVTHCFDGDISSESDTTHAGDICQCGNELTVHTHTQTQFSKVIVTTNLLYFWTKFVLRFTTAVIVVHLVWDLFKLSLTWTYPHSRSVTQVITLPVDLLPSPVLQQGPK